jgi:hypothetical protein
MDWNDNSYGAQEDETYENGSILIIGMMMTVLNILFFVITVMTIQC